MCGINGFTWKDTALIERMNKTTAHRGPDGTGVFTDDGVSLGHNRLAIIDLSDAGRQPMESHDGNLVITFNGEIYNFEDIKKEIGEYPWKSHSDTEVILAAYEKWGKGAFQKLNGMFALAIWNKATKELLIARDRAGVKPLYYFFDGTKLIFSSEIKAILEHGMPRVLDRDAFALYLRVLYVPAPLTMFQGIKKLMPGGILSFQNGKLIEDFFVREVPVEEKPARIEKLQTVLDRAIERQLVSDRPVGIYLSGGIDSSVVLDAVAKVRKNIDTFSVGFDLRDDEEKDKFNADFLLARTTAARYGTHHHEILMQSDDIPELLQEAVWHLDEPISNATILPMFVLARFVKPTATVVLGGDGGDELFGGYDRYRYSIMSSRFRVLPHWLRSCLTTLIPRTRKFDTNEGVERFMQFMFQKDAVVSRVVKADYQGGDTAERFFKDHYFTTDDTRPFTARFLDTDRHTWLVDESFMRTDKMGMASGLEARVPFLDNEVLALARTIPLSQKVDMRHTKKILKESYRGRIPDFLFTQPKRGWFSPGAKWLRHPKVSAFVSSVLTSSYYPATAELFDFKEIQQMLRDHHDKKEYNLTMLWALLTFQVWAKRYNVSL